MNIHEIKDIDIGKNVTLYLVNTIMYYILLDVDRKEETISVGIKNDIFEVIPVNEIIYMIIR